MITTFDLQVLGFTPTQSKVINGLANGKSNQEIADEILVAEKTVRWHLTKIYRKAGVKNRMQMVLWLGEKQKAELIREIVSGVQL